MRHHSIVMEHDYPEDAPGYRNKSGDSGFLVYLFESGGGFGVHYSVMDADEIARNRFEAQPLVMLWYPASRPSTEYRTFRARYEIKMKVLLDSKRMACGLAKTLDEEVL